MNTPKPGSVKDTPALRERVCAICGRGGSTTPVTVALAWLGIKGHYAHTKCLKRKQKESK